MLDPNKDNVVIPAKMIPSFRTSAAIERGVEKNILLKTWGGLGDQICAEPTLRFALKTFRDCRVSLASECPELFSHLRFDSIYDLRKVTPLENNYLVFNTINDTDNLSWEFMSHMLVNCVDYPSLSAFRCMIPIDGKEIKLVPSVEDRAAIDRILNGRPLKPFVVIHAGRHWQSKTFPKAWWETVINTFVDHKVQPVLIGANTDDNRGTVDVDATNCLDLRDKLSVMESVALLQTASVLLTNDSAPLHMAASGDAWIGYVATCKHPDYITHWRRGKWGWRMQNFGLGGIWDELDYCPNKENKVEAENVGEDLLNKWLPEPEKITDWALRTLG